LDYRVESVLGRGGMSVVYLAEDLRLKRKVALKLLAPDLAGDERFRERFLRESALAAAIDHPNVIPIYEAGEVEGVLYIAMRHVAGTDLKVLLREEGALEPGRALAIVGQVADALDAAHAHGLVHRDVKPANVLLATQGGGEHAYLSDFGLTKSASFSTDLTRAGQLLGTIDYVAPEQIRGESVDGRADQYSLGCLLFECLTGEVPFRRDAEVAVIYAQLQERPPRVSERRHDLARALDAVLTRALAKVPENRYSSCREVVTAAEAASRESVPHRLSRQRLAVLLLASLGAVVLATVLVLASTRGDAPVSAEAADYRVTFSEQVTTAAAGAEPDLALIAAFDDGHNMHGYGLGPSPQTAEVVFRVDRRQFEAGQSGLYGLYGAPLGTQLGYFTISPGGGNRVQQPLRKAAIFHAANGDRIIRLSHDTSREYRDVTPLPRRNSTLRVTPDSLILTVHLQEVAHLSAKAGIDFSFQWVGVHFFGSFVSLKQRVHFIRNPQLRTTFRASVSARRCLDALCTSIGPRVEDVAAISVPRELTMKAPRHAVYGQPARFSGRGHAGDSVTVAFQPEPRRGPSCTPVNVDHVPQCRPRFRPALRKITERRTRVDSDGTWSLELPVGSGVVQGPGYEVPFERFASGRYVAVAYTGTRIHGPVIGGSFSTLAAAPTTTIVSLKKPAITITPRGRRLRVAVAVAGADQFVAVTLRARGRTIATGPVTEHGMFVAEIDRPRRASSIEAVASALGAVPSRSTRELVPASA
jgi:serine/threonine-protein kinase